VDQLGDAEHHDRDEWARFDDAQSAVERTTSYDIGARGRRRFLKAVAEICWAHDVSWEWDLVGAPGLRKVEITFRGPDPALDAVETQIAIWRQSEAAYWSSPGGGGGSN
jgi:hypothetical protein